MSDLSGRFAARLSDTPFALLGMIHLQPLPVSPRWSGSVASVVETAIADARAFQRAGFDGVVVENSGDAPFVPYASPAETLAAMARDALDRGLADGLVVTGPATGAAVHTTRLRQVAEAAGGRPVLVGSGTRPEALNELHAAGARGAIVGTWCKTGGRIEAPVDPERAARMVAARGELFD